MFELLTLDTFNILLQAWASASAPDLSSAAFEACVQILDRCSLILSHMPAICVACLSFCPALVFVAQHQCLARPLKRLLSRQQTVCDINGLWQGGKTSPVEDGWQSSVPRSHPGYPHP